MRILGVIPARGGSKGVPHKNIRPLAGKPLIVHTIEAARASRLSKVIVSTDDESIAEVARRAGALVPFVRPADLASDSAKSMDVAIHALKTMEAEDAIQYDAVMLLQPTTPFRRVEDINNAIDKLSVNPEADSVISVVDVEGHHPARMKYIEDGRLVDPPFVEAYENQNRQELRPMFIRNGAVYLTRRETLLQRSYKGKVSLALIMPGELSINIDTLRDFDLAEWTYGKFLSGK
ncbi:MAG TPA: acylneuraminate cytidylyltransferase family protein [Cyclobacteriaceae bacterium]|nr:acylneuraminate cytidylyltransferase family protein [Cyclobacteriaceae bacterium]